MKYAPLAAVAVVTVSLVVTGRAQGDAQPAAVLATPALTPASVQPKPPLASTPPAAPLPPAGSELAQPDTSRLAPFEKGIEFQPKGAADKVAFSLDDADLSELLRVMGQLTGRRFIIATTKIKSFKASVFSPQKITVAEAYQAFLAILQSNALTVLPSGGFWKVVDTLDVTRQSSLPLARGSEPVSAEERYVTRIQRLAHASAEELATNVLAKFQSRDGTAVAYGPGNLLILTDTGENIRRMLKIVEEIDVASDGARDRVWMEPLFYVASADMEKKLGEIFDLKSAAKPAVAPAGAAAVALSTSGDDHLARLVALDRPNALVIVGTKAAYDRALAFIRRIDVPVSSEGDIHVVALQHADAKKIVPAINEAVQGASAASGAPGAVGRASSGPLSILEGKVLVSAEETTNSILVTSSERDFGAVRDVIRKLDLPRRQVYIEAVVMDVTMKRSTDIGVKLHGIDSVSDGSSTVFGGIDAVGSITGPSLTDTTLQAFALGVKGPSVTALGMTIPAFGAMINLYAKTEEADILSTPHILATDNTPAEIHVQLNTSLQQNAPSISSLGSLGGASGASSSLASLGSFTAPAAQNYGKIGPKIKVTPHLNGADEVRLEVEETISDLVGDAPSGTLGTVSFLERGATTTLTVRDQETVVIGGLVRDKVSHTTVKTPILGDIPLLGALFRHKSDTVEKSNLVLILTPYIIREQDDLRRIFERKMQERQEFIDHSTIFSMHDYEPHKDYTRTRGLLEEVRQRSLEVEERRTADLAMRPKEVKEHEGTEPLDLPTAPLAAPVTVARPNGATPTVARAVERVER